MWALESGRERGQEGNMKVAWLGGMCVEGSSTEGGVRAPEKNGLTLAEGGQHWREESRERAAQGRLRK